MNVHDSERLAGVLEEAGYAPRRRARGRRPRRVQHLRGPRERRQQALRPARPPRPAKAARPGQQIAVGGCLAQKDRARSCAGRPGSTSCSARTTSGAAGAARARAAQRRGPGRDPRGAGDLPVAPARAARLRLRGLGVDLGRLQQHLHVLHRPLAARQGGRPAPRRRPRRGRGARRRGRARGDAARAERQRLRGRVRRPRRRFAELLRACGDVEGLERVRFTSPHPRDFTSDVIAAMAETPNVCPQLHMPLQSGSDGVLRRCAARYRARRYLDHRRGPRGDARRGADHRHHRRLPRRDRGGLRGHAATSCARPGSRGVHLPVLAAPGHPGRDAARPGAQGRRPGALRPARRAAGGDLLGGQPGAGRAATSSCWSRPGRAARTARPAG